MVRLNFEKELKSTVRGTEFQQFITRPLKKLALEETFYGQQVPFLQS